MDTSQEYVKMCKNANIDWETPTIGVAHMKEGALFHYDNNLYVKMGDELIPLFRQDQLQRIYEKLTTYGWAAFDKECLETLNLLEFSDPGNFFSKEYVGLIVIMGKFNKTWNGETWETL
jgi:hypothetical protein